MKKSIVLSMTAAFVAAGIYTASVAVAGDMGKMHKEGMAGEMAEGVALKGACPVCLTKGHMMMGDKKYSLEHDGKTYYFMSEEDKMTFMENPEKYIKGAEAVMMKMTEAKGDMMAAGEETKDGMMDKGTMDK